MPDTPSPPGKGKATDEPSAGVATHVAAPATRVARQAPLSLQDRVFEVIKDINLNNMTRNTDLLRAAYGEEATTASKAQEYGVLSKIGVTHSSHGHAIRQEMKNFIDAANGPVTTSQMKNHIDTKFPSATNPVRSVNVSFALFKGELELDLSQTHSVAGRRKMPLPDDVMVDEAIVYVKGQRTGGTRQLIGDFVNKNYPGVSIADLTRLVEANLHGSSS